MDSSEIHSLLGDLDADIENLEAVLRPLTASNLSDITSKLPLLDRARLNVLVAYAIESLVFSALKLNGIEAKEHPVYNELARVKEYFRKIEEARMAGPGGMGVSKRNDGVSLNKTAAGRIIKHALSGNNKYDAEKMQRETRENAIAQKRLVILDEEGSGRKSKKRQAEETAEDVDSGKGAQSSGSVGEASLNLDDEAESKAARKERKRAKKLAKQEAEARNTPKDSSLDDQEKATDREARRSKKKKKKAEPPKSAKQVFQKLLHREPKSSGGSAGDDK